MALLERIRATWSGFPGAPGVSTFYATNASVVQPQINDLFGALTGVVPASISILTESSGDVIESTTGEIQSTWTSAVTAALTGQSSGQYAAPVGAQIQWLTPGRFSGRRLVGKTFIVPLSGFSFQADGSLTVEALSALNTAANNLVVAAAGNFKVYQRPQQATPSWTDVHGRLHPAKLARAGGFGSVIGHRVPDKAVVLRSRRD